MHTQRIPLIGISPSCRPDARLAVALARAGAVGVVDLGLDRERGIAALDKRTMQKVLAGIDTALLAMALKACDEEIADALLGATSQRTRDMIQEERELLGALPLTDVLDAQRKILLTVRDLMDSGEITVSKGGATLVS